MTHNPENPKRDIAKELGLEPACPERSRRDPECNINTAEGRKVWQEIEAELEREAEEEQKDIARWEAGINDPDYVDEGDDKSAVAKPE